MPMESSKALIELDLKTAPLGQGPGDPNLALPFNATAIRPRVYIVNRSATQPRRIVKVAVSGRRGAREALMADELLRKDFTPQGIYDEANKGADMNVYEDGIIKPVVLRVTFNSEPFFIYPAKCKTDKDGKVLEIIEKEEPHLVPDGVWDLYLGNYDRMHSDDHRVVGTEAERLAVTWTQRRNPVFQYHDELGKHLTDNPFGFVEFIRVVEKEAPQRVDQSFVTAMDLVEV